MLYLCLEDSGDFIDFVVSDHVCHSFHVGWAISVVQHNEKFIHSLCFGFQTAPTSSPHCLTVCVCVLSCSQQRLKGRSLV